MRFRVEALRAQGVSLGLGIYDSGFKGKNLKSVGSQSRVERRPAELARPNTPHREPPNADPDPWNFDAPRGFSVMTYLKDTRWIPGKKFSIDSIACLGLRVEGV